MTRRLIAFNLLLAVLIFAAGWRLRTTWLEREGASARFFTQPVQPMAPPVVLIPDPPAKLNAMSYLEVAQQLMFSRDRNPTVIVEVVAPKPMPALPLYYGLINLGDGPKVVLAAARDQGQRSYQVGQQVGDFKLIAIEPAGLVFDWEGKRVAASYAEIRDTKPASQPQTGGAARTGSAAAAQTQKPAAAATSIGSSAVAGPGADTGSDVRPCVAGDTSPAGTVTGGFKKVLANSPFGKSCYWEKVR
ncbi:MAG TPA: hypothetical protein PKJ41_13925 [Bryobacteraceae bacterium]|mgnify:CR=1 FL=1|nr:hypothetical protein [Bryobacteraceae bacterium]HPT29256.1 hypothetical protein [Bryobacteraceae bacterium]